MNNILLNCSIAQLFKRKQWNNATMQQSKRGFTLIELLVVFSVIASIAGIGLASFASYSNRQKVNQSFENFHAALATARSRAQSQVKPADCASGTLEGYQVYIADSSSYETSVVCTIGGTVRYDINRRTYRLAPQVTFTAGVGSNFLFRVLTGGVDGADIAGTSVQVSGYNTNRGVFVFASSRIVRGLAGTPIPTSVPISATAVPTNVPTAVPTSPPTPTSSPTPFPTTNPFPSGIISYWKMDETTTPNANDSIDLVNGNATAGVTENQPGRIGRSKSFNGTGYIDFGSPASFNFGSGDFSWSAWIKIPSSFTGTGFIISNDNNATNHRALQFNIGRPRLTCRDASNNMIDVSWGSSINNDLWHHVVAVRSGATGYIYVDGQPPTQASNSSTGSCDNPGRTFIGARDTSPVQYFLVGSIDEVGVWNRALSSSEVTTLWNSGNGRQP